MIFQHIRQELPGRIHDKADLPPLQARQDLLVHILRQRAGDAAREHQRVAGGDRIELFIELHEILLADHRPLGVDLGLRIAFELDVDARVACGQPDKIRAHASACHGTVKRLTRKARDKAQRDRLAPEVRKHRGNIDALAAELDVLGLGAVRFAAAQPVDTHDIIDRGIKGQGIDHKLFSPSTVLITVSFL